MIGTAKEEHRITYLASIETNGDHAQVAGLREEALSDRGGLSHGEEKYEGRLANRGKSDQPRERKRREEEKKRRKGSRRAPNGD